MFCDVSEKGYDCCVYAVSEARVELLLAKSKVAPVSPLTLACLELSCAICFEEFRVPVNEVVGWADSLMTWYWLQGPSHKW